MSLLTVIALLWSCVVLGLLIIFGIYVVSFKTMGKYSVIVEIMESVEQVLYSVISVIIVLQMIISSRKVSKLETIDPI